MKKFCECNGGEWISRQSNDPKLRFQSSEFSPNDPPNLCKVCYMFTWREPYYENMMFDLREMNR